MTQARAVCVTARVAWSAPTFMEERAIGIPAALGPTDCTRVLMTCGAPARASVTDRHDYEDYDGYDDYDELSL